MTRASSLQNDAAEISVQIAHPYKSRDNTKLWKRDSRVASGNTGFRKTAFFNCSKACLAAPSLAAISDSMSILMASLMPRCRYAEATRTVTMCDSVATVMQGWESRSNIAVRQLAAPGPRYITTASVFPLSKFIVRPRARKAVDSRNSSL